VQHTATGLPISKAIPIAIKPALRSSAITLVVKRLSLNTATAMGAFLEPGEKTKCVTPLATHISSSAFTIL
jgi:hypothetical protein